MQQNYPALLVNVEKDPGDSVLGQTRPHFVDAVAQWFASGHPNRPAELDSLDVFANPLAVVG
jgi:hypothetical protein